MNDVQLASNIQVTYKLKNRKKKAMGSEMKFGVNVAAPFAGMKREEGISYPYAKQVSMSISTTCLI